MACPAPPKSASGKLPTWQLYAAGLTTGTESALRSMADSLPHRRHSTLTHVSVTAAIRSAPAPQCLHANCTRMNCRRVMPFIFATCPAFPCWRLRYAPERLDDGAAGESPLVAALIFVAVAAKPLILPDRNLTNCGGPSEPLFVCGSSFPWPCAGPRAWSRPQRPASIANAL